MKACWGMPLIAIAMMSTAAANAQEAGGAVLETETDLTETEVTSPEAQARRWGLTTEEYRRYEEALAGPRGRLGAANISPIEVLGIEATTTAERDRYSEIWVKMIRNDTAKVLAFTRSVHAAWQRLHPDEPLIDRGYINSERARNGSRWGAIPLDDHEGLSIDDQLLIFTKVDCETCDNEVLRLIGDVQAGAYSGLDIYVLDVPDGDVVSVQNWAKKLQIPANLVQDGTLTLNFDRGALQKLTNSMQFTPSSMPVVMRRKGQDYDLVSLQ